MTKGENINLYATLTKLGKFAGVKFAYAVAKNISLLKPEYEALVKAVEPSDDFKKFEIERVELAKYYAKKNEAGEPISKDGKYELEDEKVFEFAFEALKETHKLAIDARHTQIKEQEELLKEESTVVLYKVKLEEVPKDITAEQMSGLLEIIEE
jgi:hypothetical protein